MRIKTICIAVVILLQAGCATLISFSPDVSNRSIYGGTRIWTDALLHPLDVISNDMGAALIVSIVDMPLSLVADTILLPYAIYYENKYLAGSYGDIASKSIDISKKGNKCELNLYHQYSGGYVVQISCRNFESKVFWQEQYVSPAVIKMDFYDDGKLIYSERKSFRDCEYYKGQGEHGVTISYYKCDDAIQIRKNIKLIVTVEEPDEYLFGQFSPMVIKVAKNS